MNPVYSYYDANGLRNFIEGPDVTFTGPWSFSGTYFAPPIYQATTVGSSSYLCVTTNSGHNPALPPTPTRFWSPLVIASEDGQAASDDSLLVTGTNAQVNFSAVNLFGTHIHASDVATTSITSGSLYSAVISTPALAVQNSSFTMRDDQNTNYQVKLHTSNGTTAFVFTPLS